MDEKLFQKNLSSLQKSNPNLSNQDLCLERAREKALNGYSVEQEWENWIASNNKVITLPSYIPRSSDIYEDWKSKYGSELSPIDVGDFYGKHEDPHLYRIACALRECVEKAGYDPHDDIRVLQKGGYNLIVCGSGDGRGLAELLKNIQPRNIIVCVTSWDDLISSFGTIDWFDLVQVYQKRGGRIDFNRVKDFGSMLQACTKNSLLGLEHAYVFTSMSSEEKLKEFSLELFGEKPKNLIHYLGYTVDEYNMVINSSHVFRKSPRVYSKPAYPVKGKAIVCGSGPSLDLALQEIKELEKSHVIIAGGSNIRTLLKAGIRVDVLALVERDVTVYEGYSALAEEFDISNTILAMSCTCNEGLLDVFPNAFVYFRPALTPLSIFSASPDEILEGEGPEAVNAAFALAADLGFGDIALFGVDLGTATVHTDRSKDALWFSDRKWTSIEKGNLRGVVHTNKFMLDVKMVIEAKLKSANSRVFNCSDGLFVTGAEPIAPGEYLERNALESGYQESLAQLHDWHECLSIYNDSMYKSAVETSGLRQEVFLLCNGLADLFSSSRPWFPDVLHEIDALLTLDVYLKKQAPRRIVRSTVYKAVLAITQQFYIMSKQEGDSIYIFGSLAKKLLQDIVASLETEMYQLADILDRPLEG